jgi:hypothetical protein
MRQMAEEETGAQRKEKAEKYRYRQGEARLGKRGEAGKWEMGARKPTR